jgi:hypothetical protein
MGSPWDIIVLTSPHRNHRKVLFEGVFVMIHIQSSLVMAFFRVSRAPEAGTDPQGCNYTIPAYGMQLP